MSLFPTNVNQVQAFAGALYGVQVGSITLAQVNSDIQASGLNNVLNSYYTASFGGMTNASVAVNLVTNLGLTGAARSEAAAYVTAQLNGVATGARGAVISSILNLFSSLASDATFGEAATAWNNKLMAAATYTGAANVAIGTIVAPDTSVFTLTTSSPTVSEGNAGLKTVTFELTLDRAPNEPITVQAQTLSGSATGDEDYVPLATSVTFAAGQRVATVSINVVGDMTFEANETFSLRVTGERLASTVVATATIANDDLNPEQSQLNAYASAKLATITAQASADAALGTTQTDAVELAATQTAVTDLVSAQAFVVAASQAILSAALATTSVTDQLSAAQAQLTAALGTAGMADDAEAQAAVASAEISVVSANTAAAFAQAAVPLAQQAVVDFTALNLNLHASNVETISGSLGDDVFIAEAGEISADQINGRAGNDTLLVTGTNMGALTLTSVETIKVDGANPAISLAAALNIADSTGLTTLHLVDTAQATLNNAPNLIGLVMTSSTETQRTQTASISYAAAAVSGTTTAQNIVLNNANAVVNANGIEHLNITVTGSNNSLAGPIGAGVTTIMVAGTGSINLGAVDNVATTINASAMSGGIAVTAGVASSILGGQGMDNITGSGANDSINGGAGDDLIVAGGGNDVIDGGEGNDSINASSGNNVIFGGAGQDEITLGTGFDAVDAGSGDDMVIAGANLDGLDVVRGGAGFDTLVMGGLTSDVFLQNVSGVEQFQFATTLNTTNYKLLLAPTTGVTNFLSTSPNNDDVFDATTGGFTSGLTFNMGGGDDTLKGGSGDDSFVFTNNYELNAQSNGDSIHGGDGNNKIVLDVSDIEAGMDAYVQLEYITNISTFYVTAGESTGKQIYLDIDSAGDDQTAETITVNASDLTDSSNSFSLYINSRVDAEKKFHVTGGSGADTMQGGIGNDTILGGQGNDLIYAGDGANYVNGGEGEDLIYAGDQFGNISAAGSTLEGGAGRDEIYGSHGDGLMGADVLIGGTGSDILDGRGGNDTLTGGSDSDIFIVNSNLPTSVTTITDFNVNQDRIFIKNYGNNLSNVSFKGTAANFSSAQAAISDGGEYEAVYQADINTLWIDSNNDGTLNANDTRVILQGVTNLSLLNVSSDTSSNAPTLNSTLLDIEDAAALFDSLPNAVYIVKDTPSDLAAALNMGGDTPTADQLTARALTAATLAQALEIRFDENPTPQQLLAVAAVTNSQLIYAGIAAATPGDLVLLNGTRFADPSMAVTLTASVSLTVAAAMDAAWGQLTLAEVTDTAAALIADADTNEGVGTYITGAVGVTVSDAASLAQIVTIDGQTSGSVNYQSLTDTADNFASPEGDLSPEAYDYINLGQHITVTTAATTAQLNALNQANGNGTLVFSSVTDSAGTLNADASTNSGNGTYVNGTVNVTVSTPATLEQLSNIDGNTTGSLSYAGVTDTASSYASAGGVLTSNAIAYATSGKNVVVTNAATLAQLVILDSANGVEVDGADDGEALDWTFAYNGVSDTVTNIATTVGVLTSAAQTYIRQAQPVNATGQVNVAQIMAIDAATTGAIAFGTVEDTAANLASSSGLSVLDGVNASPENHYVVITDAATAAQFNAIQAANGSGDVAVNRLLASTSADVLNLTTGVVGAQTVVYTNGLQASTAVFSNISDSTQLAANDTFTLAGVDVLTLGAGDKVDVSAFNLSGQALVTDLTVNGTTIRDGSWMIVAGEYNNAGTFLVGDANTTDYVDARLLLWDGNATGGVGAVNMQGIVIVGTTFASSDLILLA